MWIRRKQKAGRARKLSAEILEYLVFSVVVAAFTFLFLYAMGQSVSDVYLERNEIRRCCSWAQRLAEERVLERMTDATPSGWQLHR